jgi:outer membrane protein OmpA-like peptidoglycan-associated protein
MKTILKKGVTVLAVLLITISVSSCKTVKNANNKQKGAVIGGAGGAVIGGVLGNNVGKGGKGAEGAIIGGVAGTILGGLLGNKMDKQAQQIENEIPGAKVERINDEIKITFDENSGVNFETGKKDLNYESKQNLNKLVTVLKEYPDTDIFVEGHTDNLGSSTSNMKLSQQRAQSVTSYLHYDKGISFNRIKTSWYGEDNPLNDNSTSLKKAQNRRVNILIKPNAKMINDSKNN